MIQHLPVNAKYIDRDREEKNNNVYTIWFFVVIKQEVTLTTLSFIYFINFFSPLEMLSNYSEEVIFIHKEMFDLLNKIRIMIYQRILNIYLHSFLLFLLSSINFYSGIYIN